MTNQEETLWIRMAGDLAMAATIFKNSSKPWTDKDKDQREALDFALNAIIETRKALEEPICNGHYSASEGTELRLADYHICKADEHFCLAADQSRGEQLRFDSFHEAGFFLKKAATFLTKAAKGERAEPTNTHSDAVFVIRSVSKQGFWSSEDRWVADIESATKYSQGSMPYEAHLPLSSKNDAEDAEFVVADEPGLEDFDIDSNNAPS